MIDGIEFIVEGVFELVSLVWDAASEVRESSIVGESEMDRQSRRLLAWICGGVVSLVVLGVVLWQWLMGGG
ncbi:hypothetical protein [Luteolibacter soli]|uniref:Uncharacterized protein n=1 Tax=Luteolibacter soli TaxID=3135280 RepID=A0ABU9B347_9BACT